jgi:predicted P-loop ATPase
MNDDHTRNSIQNLELPEALQPLTEQPRWVIWRLETVRNKPTKVPYQALRPQKKASTKDPHTWASYRVARSESDQIGYCLHDSDVAAFDLDKCRNKDTGEIHPWAQALVERADSYTEITPSGTGLRIIGFGTGGEVHRKIPVVDGVSCEIYRHATRYITMTGQQVGDAGLKNIDAIIDAILIELEATPPGTPADGGHHGRQPVDDDEDELERTIRDGGENRHGESRSEQVWWVINEMLRRGYLRSTIAKTILNPANGISAHVLDEGGAAYADKQITNAVKKIELAKNDKGKVYITQDNIRIALLKLGVTVRYDQFADRVLIKGLEGFGPTLDDPGMVRLRLVIDQRLGFLPGKDMFNDVVEDTARLNGFHPVRNYLLRQSWDGVERIDRWLTTYAGAEDTEYTRAVGKLMLVAAVRRVRRPGCKFDEMPVLESPQGHNKSEGLKLLAVHDDWFTNSLQLNADAKVVIETLRGRWIVEAAELSGMKSGDIEHLKAFLSRTIDRARMAYGRRVTEAARQCAIVGTTNDDRYLRDHTGNRRFWPVKVRMFDLEKLANDRDQLWAEAAVVEASGVSIRLDRSLWAAAAREQEQRTVRDPFLDKLHHHRGHIEHGRIASETVWTILDLRGGQRTHQQNLRMGNAMRALGWRRPNKSNLIYVGDGKLVVGFLRGPDGAEGHGPLVEATPTDNGVHVTTRVIMPEEV